MDMKTTTWLGLGVALAALLAGSDALAQGKIGYVNLNSVLEGTEEGKAIVGKLQKEFEAKQKELQAKMKDFEERAKQFQSQAKMLKDDVRAERMKALAQEEQQLQGLLMQYQTDINKKKGEALGQFEVKLRAIIETVAQKEGLDYILRHEVLLFGPPKMDMTNDVIREYDKKFPKKAAAPAK